MNYQEMNEFKEETILGENYQEIRDDNGKRDADEDTEQASKKTKHRKLFKKLIKEI